MPRGIPKKSIESEEQVVGQATHIDMPTEGDVKRVELVEEGIQVVDESSLGDYAKELAFMEEPVTVMIHESTDQNAEPIVDLYCNGVPQRFIRGVPVTVKRKYVQILCDARQTSIQTMTGVQGNQVINRINKHTATRYPFSVVEDQNRRGPEWLRAQLAKA